MNRSAAGHLSSIANVRVDRVTPEIVRGAIENLSPHVARQAVNAVKGSLKHVAALGYEVVPVTVMMPSPRPDDTGQRALSISEVEAMAERIGLPHGEVVLLLAYTD